MPSKAKTPALTAKQKAFVAQYVVDKNATKAAVRAGYSGKTATTIASELMRKPLVAAAIDAALEKQIRRIELSGDKVLQGLARLAFFDSAELYEQDETTGEVRLKPVPDMPREVRDALVGIDIHHDGADEPGHTVKVKVASRVEALVALGKHYRLFADVHQHEVSESLEQLLTKALGAKP